MIHAKINERIKHLFCNTVVYEIESRTCAKLCEFFVCCLLVPLSVLLYGIVKVNVRGIVSRNFLLIRFAVCLHFFGKVALD